jgi:phosphoribosylformimino-5-aminoimidazole carboxamide ribotide isomerase
MRIIPAIDIMNGKCVRLTRGDYATQKIYSEDPLDMARQFEDAGFQYLHLVDLEGARSGHIVNHKVLSQLAVHTSMKIDFGGGLKTTADVRRAFENGATQITAGSIACRNPELFMEWLELFGNGAIILGADALNRKIMTEGWLTSSETDVVDFIRDYWQKGIEYVVCTDIAKDGMLAGTGNELYREILDGSTVSLIASGGVSSIDDLIALKEIGCEGAIVGKAIYEQKITLAELAAIQ